MLRDSVTMIVRLLVAAAVLSGIEGAPDRAQAFEQRTNSWKDVSGAGPHFVAVFGEVGRPGVFELNGPLPTLPDLLTMARGTNPAASGSIRIFRGGRTFQYFLSPKLKLGLLPNDLVIVDSKYLVDGRRGYGASADVQGRQALSGIAAAPSSQDVVQLGLVNLISRPVVLDVPACDANLAKVLALLHGPIRDKSEVAVFKPGLGLQTVAIEEAATADLNSGTVLVFDPQTVNAAVLPKLPATVTTESALTPADLLLDPAIQPAPATDSKNLEQSAVNLPRAEASGSSSSSSVATALPNLTSIPRSQIEAAVSNSGAPTSPIENSSSQASRLEPPPRRDSGARPVAPAVGNQATTGRLGIPVAVLTVAVACGLALLARRRLRRPDRTPEKPSPLAIPDPEESVDELARLISGTLPIVEEALQLPSPIELFGRVRLDSPYRIDVPHALSGPHFAPQPEQPTVPAPVADAEKTVIGEPGARRT
jgi:hypothetical protein